MYHFRRRIDLPVHPPRFVVHVSADNRYRLFVNGRQVSEGPARGDLSNWRYETVDIAPYLRAGPNVIAALVWNWGQYAVVGQVSLHTAFLLQGDGEREAAANTGPGWKVLRDEGYERVAVRIPPTEYYAAPQGESWDGGKHPWGWEQPVFRDEDWPAAKTYVYRAEDVRLPPSYRVRPLATSAAPLTQGGQAGSHPNGVQQGTPGQFVRAGRWRLVPRPIPPMEETPVRFAKVRRAQGVPADDGFIRGTNDLVVPARTKASLLLDQIHLTNAYTVLETGGGGGSTVTLTYAESLFDEKGQKGNRNEIEGKTIRGVRDVFRPDGGARRRFQTLWFRTYRYVQVDVETADEPLRVHDLSGVFTAYPYVERARFSSDLAWLKDVWEMNWRTARLCAWETYFDTPYYEQLQYVGDTRVQALISLYVSGDDRLVRNAVEQFDQSRAPEGITLGAYPTSDTNWIPTFSLVWVAMVHDYWMHREDQDFVRKLLPGVRSVLSWYGRYVDRSGMLAATPGWNFVDWAREWKMGSPPVAETTGRSAVVTLQYVYALDRAAELEDALGSRAEAGRYRALAGTLREATREVTWDSARGLFADAPDRKTFSQQTNVMAVLTDAVPAAERRQVMERVLADRTLTQSTYYYTFYLFEALRKAGLGDRYVEQLGPWRGMLELGLTTTPENPEPTRSDSHAWSAHPNYGLLATVLGVRPREPGFRSVRVEPHLGPLRRAEGRVPHPLGDIDVLLERRGGRGVRAEVTLPRRLNGVFVWGGREVPLRAGRQVIEL